MLDTCLRVALESAHPKASGPKASPNDAYASDIEEVRLVSYLQAGGAVPRRGWPRVGGNLPTSLMYAPPHARPDSPSPAVSLALLRALPRSQLYVEPWFPFWNASVQ